MSSSHWNPMKVVIGALGVALCLCQTPARADEAAVEDLKARLDRLEKQNERLEKKNERLEQQNEYFQKVLQAGGIPAAGLDAAIGQNKAEVEKIIADYMKAQEKAAKDAEAKKKAEADAKGYVVGTDLTFKASWSNGLNFETPQKDFKVHVGGRIQHDWYWFTQDDALKAAPPAGVGALNDGTFFRRIRLQVDGTAYEIMEWDFDMSFETSSLSVSGAGAITGGSTLFFQDAWVGLMQLPCVGNFRVGHLKVPMGLESLTSSKFLTFLERATIFEAFFQEYDPGFLVFNNYMDERGTWALCYHRIDPEEDNVDFGDGDYAGTGRVTFLPVWEHNGRCLVHLGGAYQYRNADGGSVPNTVRFRSRPEFRDNVDIVGNSNRWVDTGNIVADNVQTLALEAAAVWGPLSVQGEYVNAWADGTTAGTASYNGYYVQATYFVTGEHRAYDRRIGRFARVRPHENFFAVRTGEDGCGECCCGKGAWEVGVRYSYLDLTDLVAPGAIGGKLEDWTLGLNWYLNPNMTVQWNYVLARRRDLVNGGLAGDADAFGMRFRLDF